MLDYIRTEIRKSYELKRELSEDEILTSMVLEVAQKAVEVYKSGRKILIAGNGGSAADAQHLAAELIGRLNLNRPALSAIALTTDTSVLTATGNDYGFEHIFARQVQANGKKGDLFIGLSTSGNSMNIIKAIYECREKGIITVGLTGKTSGKMTYLCDYCINVPSSETPRIQEAHIMIGHIICSIIEETLFGYGKSGLFDERETVKLSETAATNNQ
ncbi:MAG: D-sedoheptulose-7-phosphate isomerase [Desulfitobacteriaceae bacterium]